MSSPFLDVLSESFDTPSGVSETAARPFALIEFCHAVQRSRSSLQDHDFSTEAAEFALATLGRLTTLCASYDGVGFEQAAAEMYRRPATFRRDAALALALDREPEGAQAIVEMAAYVDRAEVGEPTSPVPLHELLIDRRLVWERLSAALAFKAPHQIEELAGNFAVFRRRFVDAYVAHHQAYQAFSETARQGLDQDATAVRALGRLNSLERLGPPRGEDLRRRLDTVEEQLVVCAEDDETSTGTSNQSLEFCESVCVVLSRLIPDNCPGLRALRNGDSSIPPDIVAPATEIVTGEAKPPSPGYTEIIPEDTAAEEGIMMLNVPAVVPSRFRVTLLEFPPE